METIVEKSKQPEKLNYLTDQLPKKYGVAKIIAKRLNDKNLYPSVAREYSENIIFNVINGRTYDLTVKREVERVVSEYLNS